LAAKHAFPQPPQLAASLDVFTSQPVDGNPSQSARGGLHEETAQPPFWQLGVPPVAVHCVPQAPQLSTFFVVSTSQPSTTCVSQSAKPVLQVIEQAPRAHVAVSLFVEHAMPQVPQFLASVSVWTSQPFDARPSQSA
jgi:hypothetical protein